jgi:hypothetical protein
MTSVTKEVRPRRLMLTGLPYFVRELQQWLTIDKGWDTRAIDLGAIASRGSRAITILSGVRRSDVWYQVWGHAGEARWFSLATQLGVPVVMHWVGHDVLQAQRYFPQARRSLSLAQRFTHWAGAPWLVEELGAIGIRSEFVPLPLGQSAQNLARPPDPLPPSFTVLTYFPDTQVADYGGELVIQLAVEFPSVRFLVVGARGAELTNVSGNVTFLGWVENMVEVYARSTVLVRMTPHDGYGGTVQEALAAGRYAIWTYPFPGALRAHDYTTLRAHVLDLLRRHQSGHLTLNEEGRRYMVSYMRPEALAEEIGSRLGRIVSSARGM